MRRPTWTTLSLTLLIGCAASPQGPNAANKAAAERFLPNVYGGDGSAIDELAAADIVVSYPAFTVQGTEALREVSRSFAARCPELLTTIHESVAEGDLVVLVWSAEGRCVGPEGVDSQAAQLTLGGISVYQFDADGRIVREVGEDSMPGPYGRLSGDGEGR